MMPSSGLLEPPVTLIFDLLTPEAQLFMLLRTRPLVTICSTRSSAVAERPRDALCLSVVSFNIPTARFLLLVIAASDLLVHKILLNAVLLSPIVSGGVRPTPPDRHP